MNQQKTPVYTPTRYQVATLARAHELAAHFGVQLIPRAVPPSTRDPLGYDVQAPGEPLPDGVLLITRRGEASARGTTSQSAPARRIATALTEYAQRKTGRMVPCPGEAHQPGTETDHCLRCLPRWGQVEELTPIDLEEARAALQDVPVGDLDEGTLALAQALEELKEARLVEVERPDSGGGKRWYYVVRWELKNAVVPEPPPTS